MSYMFFELFILKRINSFNKLNLKILILYTKVKYLFFGCSSLKKLELSNFNTNNATNMKYMSSGCSDELKKKIKANLKI